MLRSISKKEITVNHCTTTIHASCPSTDTQDIVCVWRYKFHQSWSEFSIKNEIRCICENRHTYSTIYVSQLIIRRQIFIYMLTELECCVSFRGLQCQELSETVSSHFVHILTPFYHLLKRVLVFNLPVCSFR